MTNHQKQHTNLTSFTPLEKIGQGTYSSVYKVKRIIDNKYYALKKVRITNLTQKQSQNAINQVRILASINSQHIISYKQAFYDDKLNLLCIVMEWANQGDLRKKIQQYRNNSILIQQKQIWKIIYHLVQGLFVLHSYSILHRDLKSANIFLSDNIYKIGDLNVSKVQNCQNKLAYTQTGTPYYASPQIWRDEPYNQKSDIWSLGCIIYQLCTYKTPFRGNNLQSVYKSIEKGQYHEIPLSYSPQLRQIISKCLQKDPKKRPSAQQLLKNKNGILHIKCLSFGIQIKQSQRYNQALMKTIKLPKNLKSLKKMLPKSKYESQNNFEVQITKKYSQIDLDKRRKLSKKHIHSMVVNPQDKIQIIPQIKKQKIIKIINQKKSQKYLSKYIHPYCQYYINKMQEQRQKQKQLNSKNQITQEQNNFQSQGNIQKCVSQRQLRLQILPQNGIFKRNQVSQSVDYFKDVDYKLGRKKQLKKILSIKEITSQKMRNNELTQQQKNRQPLNCIQQIVNKQQIVSKQTLQNIRQKLKINNYKFYQNSKNGISTPYINSNQADIPRIKRILRDTEVRRQLIQLKHKLSNKNYLKLQTNKNINP